MALKIFYFKCPECGEEWLALSEKQGKTNVKRHFEYKHSGGEAKTVEIIEIEIEKALEKGKKKLLKI